MKGLGGQFIIMFAMIFLSSCNPAGTINKSNSPIKLLTKNLEIQSVSASNGKAIVAWDGSFSAKTFTVKYGTESGVYPTTVSNNATSPFTISGLSNGSNYFILVTEISSGGVSYSAPEATVTPVDTFAITSAIAGNQQVTINFPTVVGASGFTIKYGTTSGVYTHVVTDMATSPYVVTGLTNGKTYYFMVTANNSNKGGQDASAPVTAVPIAASVAPTGLYIDSVTTSQVVLKWNAATGVTSYDVKRGVASGGPYQTIASAGLATTYTDSTPLNGTKYYYVVTAMNVGGESIPSNEAGAKTIAPFTVSGSANTQSQINLSWNWPTGATSFDVKYKKSVDTNYITFANVTTSSATVTGLTNGSGYDFLVTAKNTDSGSLDATTVAGTPLASNTLAVTVPTYSSAAPLVNVSEKVTITYPVVTGATNYEVFYKASSAINYTSFTTTATAPTNLEITGLTYASGPTYYFKVRAYTTTGSSVSVYSNEAHVNINPQAPAVISTLAATVSNVVKLTWAAVGEGTVTYSVYRKLTSDVSFPTTSLTTCTNVSTLTCTDNTALGGTPYSYKVIAANAGGVSGDSNLVAAKSISSFSIARVAASAAGELTVSWNSVPGASLYTLKYGTASGMITRNWASTHATVDGSLSRVVSGLISGTQYYFMVEAHNDLATTVPGQGVDASMSATAEYTGIPIDLPTAPTLTKGVTSVTANWADVPGASSYDILYGTDPSNAGPYTHVISNVRSGQAINGLGYGSGATSILYHFIIRANNANGSLVGPESSSTVFPPPPTTPTGVVALGGENQIQISWIPSSGQGTITYDVYRVTLAGGPYSLIPADPGFNAACTGIAQPAAPMPLTISCIDDVASAVLSDAPYFYVVRASADGANSSWNSIEVTAQAIATFSLNLAEIRGLASSMTLSWLNTIGARTYQVKYLKLPDTTYTVAATVNAPAQPFAASAMEYVISGLTAGATYNFLITAKNDIGDGTSLDSTVTAPIVAPIDGIPLSAFTFTFNPAYVTGYDPATYPPDGGTYGYATFGWTVSTGATTYNLDYSGILGTVGGVPPSAASAIAYPIPTVPSIYQSASANIQTTDPNPTILNHNPTENWLYSYRMEAKNAYGSVFSTNEHSNTGVWSFRGITIPAGTVEDSTVEVNWNAHPAAIAYKIYAQKTGDTAPVLMATVSDQATITKVVRGLTPSTDYYMSVHAVDADGVMELNNVSTMITTTDKPTQPGAPYLVPITTPVKTTGTSVTPKLGVSGVKEGDVVRLFYGCQVADSSGDVEAGSATVAAGATTVEITSTALTPAPGDFVFCATAENPGIQQPSPAVPIRSDRSAFFTYSVTAAVPSSITLKNPSASPGTITDPTFTVGGVTATNFVQLFSDSTCTLPNRVGSATATASSVDITVSDGRLPGTANVNLYYYVTQTPPAGNGAPSDCSSVNNVRGVYRYFTCPAASGLLAINANTSLGTGAFCVMMYEAKLGAANSGMRNASDTAYLTPAISNSAGAPWTNIAGIDAKEACRAIGTTNATLRTDTAALKYDLLSNREAMAIAQEIESIGSNWTGGVVGTGTLIRGNTSLTFPATHGDRPDDYTNYLQPLPVVDAGLSANNGCHGLPATLFLNNIDGSWTWTADQRCYHNLASGSQIYDFAGNADEIVDWSIGNPASGIFTGPPPGRPDGGGEYSSALFDFSFMNTQDYRPGGSPVYDSADGAGDFNSSTTGTMTTRGGAFNFGNEGGIYALRFDQGIGARTGFRCVYKP